ncbi:hypothetical protein K1719_010485 [Acacia pycnantha]|nr:hypothetical protein K1719_010485 [Acacia pycnantha]
MDEMVMKEMLGYNIYKRGDDSVEELLLFGDADGWWRVAPTADIPSNLRRPVRGINFNRDGMSREDWLNYVAIGAIFCYYVWLFIKASGVDFVKNIGSDLKRESIEHHLYSDYYQLLSFGCLRVINFVIFGFPTTLVFAIPIFSHYYDVI